MGEFGLRNKRELWRVQMALSKIRQVRGELSYYVALHATLHEESQGRNRSRAMGVIPDMGAHAGLNMTHCARQLCGSVGMHADMAAGSRFCSSCA